MKNNFLMTFGIGLMMLMMTGYRPLAKCLILENNIAEDSVESTYLDPGMEKVIQIAIVVKDIEAAAKHWAELLGKPVPEIRTTRPGNEVKVIYRGKPSNGQVKLTFFVLGQVVIELLEPISEGTSWQEFMDEKGEGVQHIGFKVVDAVKASQALEEAGYPVFHQGRYDSDDGTYIYHDTQDALGVVVELLHSDEIK
jgi:4-hydroxyphenylpyruvate dioxygenase-like putative hemolysin